MDTESLLEEGVAVYLNGLKSLLSSPNVPTLQDVKSLMREALTFSSTDPISSESRVASYAKMNVLVEWFATCSTVPVVAVNPDLLIISSLALTASLLESGGSITLESQRSSLTILMHITLILETFCASLTAMLSSSSAKTDPSLWQPTVLSLRRTFSRLLGILKPATDSPRSSAVSTL